jgi:hypothetical protein
MTATMMIGDRDLLVLEPALFTTAAAGATRIHIATDAALSGATLTSAGSDFTAKDIDAGHVAVVDGVAVEVTSRASGTQLQISLPRASADDAAIQPEPGSGLAMEVLTFARAIAQQQQAFLAEIGFDPDQPGAAIDASAIVNADDVSRLLTLRTAAAAFALAAAASPADEPLAARAALYAKLATRAAAFTIVAIDGDGDGVADMTRHLAVGLFMRA